MPGYVTLLTNKLSELIALWGGLTLLSLMALIMLTLAFIPRAWQQRLGVHTINRFNPYNRGGHPDQADSLFARTLFLCLGTGAFAGALLMLVTKLL